MKRMIVTGAASGLGRAIALRYARESADICIADVNMEGAEETLALVESEGGQGWIFKLDAQGNIIWQNRYGEDSAWMAGIASVRQTPDGIVAPAINHRCFSTIEWCFQHRLRW